MQRAVGVRASRAGLLAAMCLVLCGVTAPGAQAGTGTRKDPVGDAASSVDITKLTVGNGSAVVALRMDVVELGDHGGFGFLYDRVPYEGLTIDINRRDGQVTGRATYCGDVSCRDVTCPGLRVRWSVAKSYVSARVPQACYPGGAPDQASFKAAGAVKDSYDDTRWTRVGRG